MTENSSFARLTDVIKNRYSCRTYQKKSLEQTTEDKLKILLQENTQGIVGEKVEFNLIQKHPENKSRMKLAYGLLQNHNTYILAKVPKSQCGRVSYGFVLEKIALKVTELGLGSCWVGLFDPDFFPEITLKQGEEIPSILVVGYELDKINIKDRFVRFAVRGAKRKPWEKLFFQNDFIASMAKENAGKYAEPLEMLRLAPSAGNVQPWRIVWDEKRNTFHFYRIIGSRLYEQRGMHDIDMGICMAHFALVAQQNGLLGKWQCIENVSTLGSEGKKYVISWVESV